MTSSVSPGITDVGADTAAGFQSSSAVGVAVGVALVVLLVVVAVLGILVWRRRHTSKADVNDLHNPVCKSELM